MAVRPRVRGVAAELQQQKQQEVHGAKPMVLREHLTDTVQNNKDTYKTLLSLDGGGMRGMITAVVLQRLENTVKGVILKDNLIDIKKFNKAFPKSQMPTTVSDFDICLGDFFHMLAGTSTGGLLALYLGAQVQCGNHPPGTAAGAIHLYEEGGSTIFPERGMAKWWTLLTSGLEGFHRANGLNAVLLGTTDQPGPLAGKTLADLKTDTVVCSVDAANMRSVVFMACKRDLDSNTEQPCMRTGFGTYKRQTVGQKAPKIPCRVGEAQKLCAGDIQLLYQEEAERREQDEGAWLPPFTYYNANFKLASVARATSAAPGFLPPCRAGRDIEPEKDPDCQHLWVDDAVFVDGGMANNDPTMIGLTILLTGHPDTSINETAILSIGCGAATDSTSWSTPNGVMGKVLAIKDKVLAIINLAMNASLEDKASFLRFLYNGLLQLPRDQFMRVQIYTRQKGPAVPAGPAAAQRWLAVLAQPGLLLGGAGNVAGAGSGLWAWLVSATSNLVSGVQAAVGSAASSGLQWARHMLGLDHAENTHAREQARLAASAQAEQRAAQPVSARPHPCKQLLLTKHGKDALNALDDASEDALDAYNKTGIFLADFYSDRMEDFVRNYVFQPAIDFRNETDTVITVKMDSRETHKIAPQGHATFLQVKMGDAPMFRILDVAGSDVYGRTIDPITTLRSSYGWNGEVF